MTKEFGELLKRTRLDIGLSQRQLGKIISLTNASISLLESGKNNPLPETVETIGIALNITGMNLIRFYLLGAGHTVYEIDNLLMEVFDKIPIDDKTNHN